MKCGGQNYVRLPSFAIAVSTHPFTILLDLIVYRTLVCVDDVKRGLVYCPYYFWQKCPLFLPFDPLFMPGGTGTAARAFLFLKK
jgi:hypothetical protein